MAGYQENVLLVLKEQYLVNNHDGLCINNFVETSKYTNLFGVQNISSIEETVTHTNALINSSTTRLEGLQLLKSLVTQSTGVVYSQYEKTWRTMLLNILQSRDTDLTYTASCDIISEVLRVSADFGQSARDVANHFLPQLLPRLLEATDEWVGAAISCINTCLEKYSSACGSFRNKIDHFLLQLLDEPSLLVPLSHCYALVARCGSGGAGGVKHSEGWGTRFQSALCELQNAYCILTVDLESTGPGIRSSSLSVPPLPESEPSRVTTLLHRMHFFTNCCAVLLTGDYPVSVKVPIRDVLDLVGRLSSVDVHTLLSRPTTALLTLAAYIPPVHAHSMRLLSALISSCGQLLVAYASRINRVLMKELLWSHSDVGDREAPQGQQRVYSAVRSAVYDTLVVWMTRLGYACHLDDDIPDLITEILADVKPRVYSLKLQSSGKPTKTSESAKKKKKGHFHELKEGESGEKVDHLANCGVCKSALKALHRLTHILGTRMKTKSLKVIQTFVLSTCLDIQHRGQTTYPVPYSQPAVRKWLYRALLATTLVSHAMWPPPIQLAAGIFDQGCRDKSLKVSSFCSEAYSVVEVMIHPRVPCAQPAVKLTEQCLRINLADVYDAENDEETNGSLVTMAEQTENCGPIKESRLVTVLDIDDASRSKINGADRYEEGCKRKRIDDEVREEKKGKVTKTTGDDDVVLVCESSNSDVEMVDDHVVLVEGRGNSSSRGAVVRSGVVVASDVVHLIESDSEGACVEKESRPVDRELRHERGDGGVSEMRGENEAADGRQETAKSPTKLHVWNTNNGHAIVDDNLSVTCEISADDEQACKDSRASEKVGDGKDLIESGSDECSVAGVVPEAKVEYKCLRSAKRLDAMDAVASPRRMTRSAMKSLAGDGGDTPADTPESEVARPKSKKSSASMSVSSEHGSPSSSQESDGAGRSTEELVENGRLGEGDPGGVTADVVDIRPRRTRGRKTSGNQSGVVCEEGGDEQLSQDGSQTGQEGGSGGQGSLEDMLAAFVDKPPENQ